MKTKCGIALLGVAITAGPSFGGSTSAMRVPRIELLSEVLVTGADVLLSDHLPAAARVSLRARAEEITLDSAPLPRNARVLTRSEILENISTSREVAEEVNIPERIVVSRDVRAITVEEVCAAIRNALARSGFSEAAELNPGDILFQSQILLGPGDAGLEVLRSDFDAGLKRGRFWLWASNHPKVLPFVVAVRFAGSLPPAGLHAAPELSRARSASDMRRVIERTAKAEVLVSAGEQATLLVHSSSFRMMADVVALERGTMGQRIRVRVLETGKIFSAQVDGHAHLEMNF
jgi:flagellar basal body P-ring formation chaperone FlgA